ncbi:hypothetical protein [Streptomyces clavuligerus]|nr:hypothetical protein [Streptomyces clavuligerus]ANW22182.1 hypothetical protein BB341_27995 [Streptomyces clavuligerus]EDY47770.1 hypothetical protein SSCG_00798 [Streptomyces clavuligerus]WDN56856.1 hypothetical protein LL058_34185 [Streptomyces clavuligerus]
MPYLIAAVVLLGALCLLDLLLTVGVIRRLRTQQGARTLRDQAPDDGMLPPRAIVGDFAATTVDGRSLTPADLRSPAVVAFLNPGCAPCHEELPRVAAALAAAPGNGVLAVVAGGEPGEDDTDLMLRELSPYGTVVHEGISGPLTEAFKVRAFPALCRVRRAGGQLVVESVGEQVLSASPALLP